MNTLAVAGIAIPGKGRREKKATKAKGKLAPIKRAAREYKKAYMNIYGCNPVMTYDGQWIRIRGLEYGVSLQRLKHMTAQLNHRR